MTRSHATLLTRPAARRPKRTADRSCPTGKVRFRDHQEAVVALHDASNAQHFAALTQGSTSRHECRAYSCGQCHGYHLTSQPDTTLPKKVLRPVSDSPFAMGFSVSESTTPVRFTAHRNSGAYRKDTL